MLAKLRDGHVFFKLPAGGLDSMPQDQSLPPPPLPPPSLAMANPFFKKDFQPWNLKLLFFVSQCKTPLRQLSLVNIETT